MHFLGNAGGPKARDRPAQGNALGFGVRSPSPVGANQLHARGFVPALSGLRAAGIDSQGVALGWLVPAPLVLKAGNSFQSGHALATWNQ